MADRSVTVVLIARIQDFERGMAAATAATKKFENELDALRRTSTVDLAHVGETAGDVSVDLDQMAASSGIAGRQLDDLGDEAVGAAAKLGVLGHELDSVDRKMGGLGGAGAKAGAAATGGLLEALGGLGSNLRGAVIPVAAGLGILLAPSIGAAVAGAVVGGVGLGGIAGGIAAAASDPRVKAAGTEFAARASAIFKFVGLPFVEPLVASLGTLQNALDDLNLDDALAPLAQHMDELTAGVAGFASQAMPGLNRALAQAGPALDILADALPQIGAAFGNMIGDISESEGALEGLDATLRVIGGAMTATGQIVALLSDSFHAMGVAAARGSGIAEDLFGWIPVVGASARSMNDTWEDITNTGPAMAAAWAPIPGRFQEVAAAQQMSAEAAKANATAFATTATNAAMVAAANEQVTASMDKAAASANGLVTAFNMLNGAMLNEREQMRAAEAAADDFSAALKASGGSMDIHTAKGRAAQAAMDALASQAAQTAQAILDNGGTVDEAQKAYDRYIGALRRTLDQAGFTKTQVDSLIGTIAKMPPSKTTTIRQNGAQQAAAAVQNLINKVSGLFSKTIYVRTIFTTGGAIASARAEGGPVEAGVPYKINERGMETVTFPANGEVHPANLTRAYTGSAGGPGGGGSTKIVLDVRADSEAQAAAIRKQVLILGGGNVQLAYGRGSF